MIIVSMVTIVVIACGVAILWLLLVTVLDHKLYFKSILYTVYIILIPILYTRCGFAGRVKLLLKHKADSAIANKKKELPLHRACASNSNIEVGVAHTKAFHSDHIKGIL